MRKSIHRAMPDGSFVVATLEIRDAGGTLSEGFSLTGEVYDRHGTWSGKARWRNDREPDSCGQVTEEIARAFPRLEPFARMHLSDLDGVPMHADANARYFLSGESERYERKHYGAEYAERNGSGYERACRTLRVSEIPAGALGALQPDYREPGEAWVTWFEGLRAQWAEEARAAREVFESIEEGIPA